MNVYHVLQVETLWRVNVDGPDRGLGSFNSIKDAMDFAQKLAQANRPATVKVYSRHGGIQSEFTYHEKTPVGAK